MPNINLEIEKFLRQQLDSRLDLLREGQRDKFNRIFPKGVPSEKLEMAIDLCDRTIRKNEKEEQDA